MVARFFVNDHPVCRRKILEQGFPVSICGGREEAVITASESDVDFVLSDCNEITRDEMLRIRSSRHVVNIAVQGEAKWYAHASYLHCVPVDEAPPADALCAPQAGPAFVPLHEYFREKRGGRGYRDSVRKVLVAMGGGDAQGLTTVALRALASVDLECLHVTVVIGAACSDVSGLQTALEDLRHRTTVVRDLPGLADLLVESDLALLAMGGTTYEAFCVGLPCIVICPTDFHNRLANRYEQQGLLCSVGCPHENTVHDVAENLGILSLDHERREEMARRALSEVDGRGVLRIVDGIERETGKQ